MFAARLAVASRVVSLFDQFVSDSNPAGASAGYRIDADGRVYQLVAGVASPFVGGWVSPASDAPLFEVRATLLSGTASSGTFGTWLACTVDRDWIKSVTAGNAGTCIFTVEIREAATGTVRASATITLESDAI